MNREVFDEGLGTHVPAYMASEVVEGGNPHASESVAPPSARGWWCKFSGEFKFLRELHPEIDRAADECELSPTFVFESEADAQWFYDKRDRYRQRDVSPGEVASMLDGFHERVMWDAARGVFVFRRRFVAGGE